MKNKKNLKRNQQSRLSDQTGKVKKVKEKYNNKNYWLEDLDDDYVPPSNRDEEE